MGRRCGSFTSLPIYGNCGAAEATRWALAAVLRFLLTFADDCLVEFVSDGFRKGINVVVAVDFDGLAGCVANYEAVMAPLQVLFQLRFELDVNIAVQVLV